MMKQRIEQKKFHLTYDVYTDNISGNRHCINDDFTKNKNKLWYILYTLQTESNIIKYKKASKCQTPDHKIKQKIMA